MTLALIAITIALLLSAAVAAAVKRSSDHHCDPHPFAALNLDV